MSSAVRSRDHRLEIQQRFEPALGNLRLIRRVLRIPAGIFEDVALNDRRRDAIVIALPDERAEHFVFGRNPAQFGERFKFTFRGGQV